MSETVENKLSMGERWANTKQKAADTRDAAFKKIGKLAVTSTFVVGTGVWLASAENSSGFLSDSIKVAADEFASLVSGETFSHRIWTDYPDTIERKYNEVFNTSAALPSENNVQLLAGNNLEGAKAAARKANETLTGEFEVVRLVDSGVKYAVQGKSSNDCAEPILNGWNCTQKLSR